MRSLLLLSAVLVVVTAQTPPHLLFTPQNYYVGTEATFSLTSYSSESFPVTLRLTYTPCTCANRFRFRCRDEVLYDEDTKPAVPAFNGQPTLLKVQLPSLNELTSRRYYVSITSHEGRNVYLQRRQINFFQNQIGFMLVKTDKPIYKPSDTVNICVVFLDSTLRPHQTNSTAEVVIRDSRRRQIFKTTLTIPSGDGVGCMNMQLSDEPNLGRWSVSAVLKMDVTPRQCQFYRSLPSSRCGFKVDEFVLPKFEVTLEGPKQIVRSDNNIEGTVDATYTFGEKVQGTVRVIATLEAGRRRESLLFSDVTEQLESGRYSFSIDAEDYRNKVRYRYDPFCVRSSVRIRAEVTESGRNDTQNDTIIVPLVSNPISVSFLKSNPNVFRPGLPYTIKGQATRADGSPATGEEVVLTATANNGQKTLFDRTISTDTNGKFSETVDVDSSVRCLKFTISPANLERSCDRQVKCFSPSPMFSPTNSFLQLKHVSPTETLSPGSTATVTAEATFPFNTLHLVVIGQGSVQLHQASFTTSGGSGVMSMSVSFPVDEAGVPRVKVLGVVARDDGELVADLIEIPVSCQLGHRVEVSFGTTEASPGDQVSIATRASPGSVVVLGVIDKSLTLLADACKSVDTNNVCRLLRGLTGGSGPDSASCSTESEGMCCPSSCTEPAKKAVADIFRAAGITLTTNMFQPTPPSPPRPPPPPFFRTGPIAFDAPSFIRPEIAGVPVPTTESAVPTPPPRPVDGDEREADVPDDGVRDFFPETWIWEIGRTDDSGSAVFTSEVPDTITTWNAEAFAINQDRGLGISPLVELTVKKELFVSLELPYSIIFKETVTVTPVVFYFGSEKNVIVRVSVTVDDELNLVENQLTKSGLINIDQGTGTPFTLKIKPRAIGRLPITICIREPRAGRGSRCIDAVKKNLFVKPGCERFQITNNIYATSGAGQQCFDYTLPSCVIPGSSKASISVTGDLLSPPDLDRLLVLPRGCGEQNMVRFSLNVVTGLYLLHTDQLTDLLVVKILNNLQTGYQRQLNYLQGQGCFAIWSNGKCSLWLTAFTARFLLQTSDNEFSSALGLSEGSELVDPVVIRSAVNYLVRQQNQSSGMFPVIGRVHNSYLLRRDDYIGLTAYVVITLRAYLDSTTPTPADVRASVERAERYIMRQYNDRVQFCNYGLALATTALSLENDPDDTPTLASMVADLKSRIRNSRSYPNACFLCNECPEDEATDSSNTTTCSSRPRGEGSSSCVETTAYALKALLQAEDQEKTVCLAQWLTEVKSGSGGFYSSQDTLVALDALGKFAEETFTSELRKTVVVNGVSHLITTENRYERRTFEIPNVPSTNNCVLHAGVGTAIIQSTLEYYGCSCCDDTETFSLSLYTKKTDKLLELTLTVRYLGSGESNMAIVDVEIPSGYVFDKLYDPSKVVQRHEVRGSNAVFYINEISESRGIKFSVNFMEDFLVEDHQQLPVTVYDYYEPDQIVTKYYLPVNSETPPPPSRPTSPPSASSPPSPRPDLPRPPSASPPSASPPSTSRPDHPRPRPRPPTSRPDRTRPLPSPTREEK